MLESPDHTTPHADSPVDTLDMGKLWRIVKKNIVWLLLIFLLTNVVAYLYIRWTRPKYESHSVVKLDVESKANILGFNTASQNLDDLAGEIELLKSNLFFNKVVDAVDMDVSYYAYGRILFQERYENSPFQVQYEVFNPAFYDRPIDLDILNEEQFVLSYAAGEEPVSRAYSFGEEVTTPDYRLVVSLTEHYTAGRDEGSYYFTINSDRALVSYLGSNMTVEPVNFNAKTIRIGFQGYHQKKVQDLVHTIDSVYLQYTQEKKNQATEQKISFLSEQLESIENRLAEYENYFEDFTITNKTNDLTAEIGETIGRLESLDTQKFQMVRQQEVVNQLYSQVEQKELIPTEPIFAADYPQDILQYIEQLNQLINERALLLGSYKENTYAVQRKEKRIALLKADITALLKSYQTQLRQGLRDVEKNRRAIEQAFLKLPSQGTQYGKNQRYYSLYENVYLSLMETKNELEIAKAGTVTDFVVLLPATLPSAPVSPEKTLIRGAGAVAGLVLSFIFVALSYVFNDKISSQPELERYTSVPILGAVPFYKIKSRSASLVLNHSPKSAISEAFRSIRTNMQFMGLRNSSSTISVTSTIGSEGKTFVATNLANVIALSGQKVVIVDVDMRKPKVHLAFDHPNGEKGISTILAQQYTVDECIISSSVPHLDFIPAGPIPPNPAEMIASRSFDELLATLKERYDVVLIDTPPVGLVTDGVLVMEKVDLPLYVFRAGFSRKAFVKTLDRLQRTQKFKNLSIILNATDATSGYGYGYGQYGSGYYELENNDRRWWKIRN